MLRSGEMLEDEAQLFLQQSGYAVLSCFLHGLYCFYGCEVTAFYLKSQIHFAVTWKNCIFAANSIHYKRLFMKIVIINGPNLNLLGKREPGIYGSESFESYLPLLRERFPDVEIGYFQSNHEGELIDRMQEEGFDSDGIVLNAGAYTHTSVALHDCIRAIKVPVVEVHISNVHQREPFRHVSMISAACKGVICGFGLDSYRLAIEALIAVHLQ